MSDAAPIHGLASSSTTNEALLAAAKDRIASVDRGTVLEATRIIMEIIEDEDGVDGEEAQRHAIAITRALIVDMAPEDEKDWLLTLVDNGILASIIDTVVNASKGLYNINRAAAGEAKCGQFLRCLP